VRGDESAEENQWERRSRGEKRDGVQGRVVIVSRQVEFAFHRCPHSLLPWEAARV